MVQSFGRAVNRMSAVRVLLIVTHRPEIESRWIGHSHVTGVSITLGQSVKSMGWLIGSSVKGIPSPKIPC